MAASVGTIPGSPAGGERVPGGSMGGRRWGTPRGRSAAPAWHMMTGATAPTGGYHSHAMAAADNAAPMTTHTAAMVSPGVAPIGPSHVGAVPAGQSLPPYTPTSGYTPGNVRRPMPVTRYPAAPAAAPIRGVGVA